LTGTTADPLRVSLNHILPKQNREYKTKEEEGGGPDAAGQGGEKNLYKHIYYKQLKRTERNNQRSGAADQGKETKGKRKGYLLHKKVLQSLRQTLAWAFCIR